MNIIQEMKDIVEVRINEKKLADKIFDKAVDPLMIKLTKMIPTNIDDAFYASKKEELRAAFKELLDDGVDKLEEKTGLELDGQA